MTRRTPWLAIAGPLIFIVALAAVFMVMTQKRTLSRATSPNHRWTVVVQGSPRLLGIGGIEVTLDYYSSAGQAHSLGVIDLCSDWRQARDRYGTFSIENDGAEVHDRVISFDRHQ